MRKDLVLADRGGFLFLAVFRSKQRNHNPAETCGGWSKKNTHEVFT